MFFEDFVEDEAWVVALCEFVFDGAVDFFESLNDVEGLRLEFEVFKGHAVVEWIVDFKAEQVFFKRYDVHVDETGFVRDQHSKCVHEIIALAGSSGDIQEMDVDHLFVWFEDFLPGCSFFHDLDSWFQYEHDFLDDIFIESFKFLLEWIMQQLESLYHILLNWIKNVRYDLENFRVED